MYFRLKLRIAETDVFGAIDRTYARPRIWHSPISIPTEGCSHVTVILTVSSSRNGVGSIAKSRSGGSISSIVIGKFSSYR